MENNRQYLRPGQTLRLAVDPEGTGVQEFAIQGVVGAGGSTVCYDAIRLRDGLPGKLKEFYPVDAAAGSREWYYSLERCPDGQLIPGGGTLRKFREMCREYLEGYAVLNRVMVDDPQSQVLKNYIQTGEILHGIAPEGSPAGATVYIWTPGLTGQTFDAYLSQVRSHPEDQPRQRLLEILSAACALADCLRALHMAGLMHLDIKPSNFLVPYDSKQGLQAHSISLFDIDTLYSATNPVPRQVGTDGFRAPEVFRGKADNRSDLYSLGAVLFYGLVNLEEIPDGLYRDSYHPDIDRMLRHSALIKEAAPTTRLTALLANILKKCLERNPNNRYESCSGLLRSLETARELARLHGGYPQLVGQNRRLAVVEENEQGINSPDIVIQKLFFEHPLYAALEEGQTRIHVLVIGSGTYGQKFIDQCLQAGQMMGYSLEITAVSCTPQEDREAYLQFRPALSRFVDVDGSMAGDPRAYGALRFLSLNEACGLDGEAPLRFLRGKDKPGNSRLVADLIRTARDRDKAYDYVFVALGSTAMNREIASLCEKETAYLGSTYRCPVCYISETAGKTTRPRGESMLYPVRVLEPITPETIDPWLEQTAFNGDLAWNSAWNTDVRKALEAFRRDEYRYSASLAYALSVPGKLYSIGIRESDPMEAARRFSREVLERRKTDPEAQHKFDTLVWLEHRRWVLKLVCEGWQAPLDETGALDLNRCVLEGTVKNKLRRTHPCLVFSTEATPLSGAAYEENNRRKWDSQEEDPALDPLDRMSLELHRRFRERAELFKAGNPLHSQDILAVEQLISGAGEETDRAWNQFLFCLKNILAGVESYSRQYDRYQQRLLEALASTPEAVRSQAAHRLELIRSAFFPVVEANLYRNYKANDEVLVEKIPFILTYRYQDTLALPFGDGRLQNGSNEASFPNVASATVLCPERIVYLYHYAPDTKLELLTRKLGAVLRYLGGRSVRCCVTLGVLIPEGISRNRRESLSKALEKLREETAQAGAVFAGFTVLPCPNPETGGENALDFLRKAGADYYDGTTPLFPSPLDNGMFLSRLREAKLPYFEFDWRRKQFPRCLGCEYLAYIHDNSSIRIQDMFALMQAQDTQFQLPEFGDDYMTLWAIYTGADSPGTRFEHAVGNWIRLCRLLEEYEERQPPLATIPLGRHSTAPRRELEYVLPEYAMTTAAALLGRLAELGAVDPDAAVTGYTSESCLARFRTDPDQRAAFDRIFGEPELLHPYHRLTVEKRMDYAGEFAWITCYRRQVKDLNLSPGAPGKGGHLLALLRKLEQRRFISRVAQSPDSADTVSFDYSAPRIKTLLTSAGMILEIYTYYQMLATGYFDDVAWSYEFRWQDGQVRNELDIVATKGFRSIIVECKSVQKLDLEYYHKLHSIAQHFGIGTVKVLVGNTYRRTDALLSASNKLQRTRGNQLGIVTVSEEEKLVNIGQTLRSLMEK